MVEVAEARRGYGHEGGATGLRSQRRRGEVEVSEATRRLRSRSRRGINVTEGLQTCDKEKNSKEMGNEKHGRNIFEKKKRNDKKIWRNYRINLLINAKSS